jgi:hypothetical protein
MSENESPHGHQIHPSHKLTTADCSRPCYYMPSIIAISLHPPPRHPCRSQLTGVHLPSLQAPRDCIAGADAAAGYVDQPRSNLFFGGGHYPDSNLHAKSPGNP